MGPRADSEQSRSHIPRIWLGSVYTSSLCLHLLEGSSVLTQHSDARETELVLPHAKRTTRKTRLSPRVFVGIWREKLPHEKVSGPRAGSVHGLPPPRHPGHLLLAGRGAEPPWGTAEAPRTLGLTLSLTGCDLRPGTSLLSCILAPTAATGGARPSPSPRVCACSGAGGGLGVLRDTVRLSQQRRPLLATSRVAVLGAPEG